MVVVDTSVLIRFFTNDNESLAQEAKRLLTSSSRLVFPEVIFPEVEYVLSGVYGATREEILGCFEFLLSLPNSQIATAIQRAVDIYRTSKLDMADCLIVARAINSKADLATYDKKLNKLFKQESLL